MHNGAGPIHAKLTQEREDLKGQSTGVRSTSVGVSREPYLRIHLLHERFDNPHFVDFFD